MINLVLWVDGSNQQVECRFLDNSLFMCYDLLHTRHGEHPNMEILSQRYVKSPDMVFRQVAGEFVLVPIRHDVADLEAVYTLGGVGARIWELLDGERDGYAILDQIAQEYDITLDEARSDLVEFLGELEAVRGIAPVEA